MRARFYDRFIKSSIKKYILEYNIKFFKINQFLGIVVKLLGHPQLRPHNEQ